MNGLADVSLHWGQAPSVAHCWACSKTIPWLRIILKIKTEPQHLSAESELQQMNVPPPCSSMRIRKCRLFQNLDPRCIQSLHCGPEIFASWTERGPTKSCFGGKNAPKLQAMKSILETKKKKIMCTFAAKAWKRKNLLLLGVIKLPRSTPAKKFKTNL